MPKRWFGYKTCINPNNNFCLAIELKFVSQVFFRISVSNYTLKAKKMLKYFDLSIVCVIYETKA